MFMPGFEFYEVKKNIISKRKWKYFLSYDDKMPFQHNVVAPKTSILSSYIPTAMLLYYSRSNTLH